MPKRQRLLPSTRNGEHWRRNGLSDDFSGSSLDEDGLSNGDQIVKSDDEDGAEEVYGAAEVPSSRGWTFEALPPDENRSLLSSCARRARLRIGGRCPLLCCLEGRGRIRNLTWRRSDVDEIARPTTHGEDHPDPGRSQGRSSRTAAVSVHGYELTDEFVDFESPRWNSLLTIEASGAPADLELESFSDAATTINALQHHEAKKEEDPFVRIVDPTQPNGARLTVIPGSWKSAVDSILAAYAGRAKRDDDPNDPHDGARMRRCDARGFRVALAGAKATGKSTCLRYLANRFLSRRGREGQGRRVGLFLLDADCGQPELSPPGMLTLSRVVSPLLQPPHTRPVQAYERACFYGHTTSAIDPPRYLDCVRELLAAFEARGCSSVEDEPILLINLDGWVKSVGGQVLEALMGLLTPDHVIQLTGDTKSQQFALDNWESDRTTLHQAFSFNSKQEPSRGPVVMEEPQSSASNGQSFHRIAPPSSLSLSAGTWRSIRMCSYFLQDPALWSRVDVHQLKGIVDRDAEIGNRLAGAKPYRVPFDSVEWNGCFSTPDFGRGICSEAAMLGVLNASIVGLCRRVGRPHASIRSPLSYHLLPCVGLGLVRAIDYDRRLFYVLTPVPFEDLRSVDCLVRGSLLVPIECLFRGVQSDNFLYQSYEVTGQVGDETHECQVLGEQPMHSRGNIGRRALQSTSGLGSNG